MGVVAAGNKQIGNVSIGVSLSIDVPASKALDVTSLAIVYDGVSVVPNAPATQSIGAASLNAVVSSADPISSTSDLSLMAVVANPLLVPDLFSYKPKVLDSALNAVVSDGVAITTIEPKKIHIGTSEIIVTECLKDASGALDDVAVYAVVMSIDRRPFCVIINHL